jgi:hypothetical protein
MENETVNKKVVSRLIAKTEESDAPSIRELLRKMALFAADETTDWCL